MFNVPLFNQILFNQGSITSSAFYRGFTEMWKRTGGFFKSATRSVVLNARKAQGGYLTATGRDSH